MCWHNCNAPHMAVVRRRRLSKSRISLHKHLHIPGTAPLLPFLQLQTLFNPTGTYPPSWRWLSCAVLPAIPLHNGGRGRRRTQTHCNTCWCRCSLLSGTDSANFLLLSFFTKSFSDDSPWQISTRIHTIVSLKIHEHCSLPGLTSLRHSSPLYSPLFTSVPSSFFLPSSFSSVLPLPSFPITYQDSSPSPLSAEWLLWLTDNASAGECWEWGQGSGLQWPQEGGSVYTPSRLWLRTHMLLYRHQKSFYQSPNHKKLLP